MLRPESVTRVGRALRDGADRAAPWVERLGRLGYVAKGAVYLLVGVLAAEAALGAGGSATGSRGAIRHALRLPFGDVLLVAVAVGLAGYALWRLIQAVRDTENRGRSAKGLVVRTGYVGSSLFYATLAGYAVALAQGQRAPGDEAVSRQHTAWLLGLPHGPWLVCLVGAVVVGVGVAQWVIAANARFRRNLRPMSPAAETWGGAPGTARLPRARCRALRDRRLPALRGHPRQPA